VREGRDAGRSRRWRGAIDDYGEHKQHADRGHRDDDVYAVGDPPRGSDRDDTHRRGRGRRWDRG
jgi:hypothetical protein